ncbi:hypothetical protein [Mucilaginibacter pedocola]|uniref:Uncharacterized protein n=1 Tax=Mucilaginibacter pedocola TaxID=1792845 RepID=A0A1S9PCT9_9SPHI|nr:hypothetical protein [Mucilaginibacter pedocola]OOQ58794.1 hypothetical protein BC343_09095 [Mucilaginibacter pedocola]
MPLDFDQILKDCIAAAKKELGAGWNDAAPFAEQKFKQYLEDMADLNKLRADGTIDEDEFKYRADLHKSSMQSVLLAVKGIGLIAAQNIINAVLGIVGKAIGAVLIGV